MTCHHNKKGSGKVCSNCASGKASRLIIAGARLNGSNLKTIAIELRVTPKAIENHCRTLRRLNGAADDFQLGAKLATTPQEKWVL